MYQDPYSSLRKTVALFSHAGGSGSGLAASVRRIWLDGYYNAETTGLIFALLAQLPGLEYVTVPWMAVRHGSAEQWSRLLGGGGGNHNRLASLEFLAVTLKAAQMCEPEDRRPSIIPPLASPAVDLSRLARLKISGGTNHRGLTDVDLAHMARTATHLREIHITGTAGLSEQGVMALVHASQDSLRVLEYTPIQQPPSPPPPRPHVHACVQIQRCRQLRDLTITLLAVCADVFDAHWTGEIEIRTAALCPSNTSTPASWQHTLQRARNSAQSHPLSLEIYFRQSPFSSFSWSSFSLNPLFVPFPSNPLVLLPNPPTD